MRLLWPLVLGGSLAASAAAGTLYKHVDAQGNVTYTDRPQQPGQAALSLPPVNVATPEARRQLEIARQRLEREEQLEFAYRVQQWTAGHGTAPVGYSRPAATPIVPRYTGRPYTPVSYVPTYYTFTTPAPNAGTQLRSHSTERPRQHASESRRAHRARH